MTENIEIEALRPSYTNAGSDRHVGPTSKTGSKPTVYPQSLAGGEDCSDIAQWQRRLALGRICLLGPLSVQHVRALSLKGGEVCWCMAETISVVSVHPHE